MKLFPEYKIVQIDYYKNNGNVSTVYKIKRRFLLFWYFENISTFKTIEDAERHVNNAIAKIVETTIRKI